MSHRKRISTALPEEWRAFLSEMGECLPVPVEVHCCGNFAAAARYGMPLRSQELEYIATLPPRGVDLLRAAGNSPRVRSRSSNLRLRFSGAVDYIEDYDKRLRRLFSTRFKNLRLYAMEAHDLVLTQLTDPAARNMEMIDYLVEKKALKPSTLWRRYRLGLRPYVARTKSIEAELESVLKRYF